MNKTKIIDPKLRIMDGAIFPIFTLNFLLGKYESTKKEITKQRIIEITKNNKQIYLSDVAELLNKPIDEIIILISELEKEGKIKTK